MQNYNQYPNQPIPANQDDYQHPQNYQDPQQYPPGYNQNFNPNNQPPQNYQNFENQPPYPMANPYPQQPSMQNPQPTSYPDPEPENFPKSSPRTSEDFRARKPQNSFYKIFPLISSILIILSFFLSLYVNSKYKILSFSSNSKSESNSNIKIEDIFNNSNNALTFVFFIFLFPLLIVFVFPIYLTILIMVRKSILRFYLFTNISALSLSVLLALSTGQLSAIIPSVVFLLIFLLVTWCIWKDLKLAQMTLKSALEAYLGHVGLVFKKFLPTLISISLICSMVAFSSTIFGLYANISPSSSKLKDAEDANNANKDAIQYAIVGASVVLGPALIYLLELLSALLYFTGASFFNEFLNFSRGASFSSPSAAQRAETAERAFLRAHSIAFGPSLGICCFGALIMTIIRILRAMAEAEKNNKNNNNNNNGGGAGLLLLVFVCLLKLFEEFMEFLTSQAYLFAAIYGTGLLESGKMALKGFQQKGFRKYFSWSVSNDLLNTMGFFVSLGFGFLSFFGFILVGKGVLADGMLNGLNESDKSFFIYFVGALFGFLVFIVFLFGMGMVNNLVGGSGVVQVTLFVEDPELLRVGYKDPKRFEKFRNYMS